MDLKQHNLKIGLNLIGKAISSRIEIPYEVDENILVFTSPLGKKVEFQGVFTHNNGMSLKINLTGNLNNSEEKILFDAEYYPDDDSIDILDESIFFMLKKYLSGTKSL